MVVNFVQQRRRETQREYRREFHRAVEAVRERDPTDETYATYHANLDGVVTTWLLDLQPAIESAVDEGRPTAERLWLDADLGFCESGLVTLADRRGDGLPFPVHTLVASGEAIEEFLVEYLDLPADPPVVHKPWTTDELEPPTTHGI